MYSMILNIALLITLVFSCTAMVFDHPAAGFWALGMALILKIENMHHDMTAAASAEPAKPSRG